MRGPETDTVSRVEATVPVFNDRRAPVSDSTIGPWESLSLELTSDPVVVGDRVLTIDEIVAVASCDRRIELRVDGSTGDRLERSRELIARWLKDGTPVYGVNTNYGALARETLTPSSVRSLQENLLQGLRCGIGKELPSESVRAAMLLRLNALAKGYSGVRRELLDRIVLFLNARVTPIVRDQGSIGASGDLIPLAQIAGALIGAEDGFRVRFEGRVVDARVAMKELRAPRLRLRPKEGLALVNGTSVMTGLAVVATRAFERLFSLVLHVHGLIAQALLASAQSFDPLIHDLKPHPGQQGVARAMRAILEGSRMLAPVGARPRVDGSLVQDRYSVRCLPQFLGPVAEDMETRARQLLVEANAVDDNPVVDVEMRRCLHGGNFLGQYVSSCMDGLRRDIALVAKHLDVQIALLVTPEFSDGLPPSLIAEARSATGFGLKGLQICGNAVMTRLLHSATGIAHLFPTHAEQFNQNINSQGFNSAVLASEGLDLFRSYLAISLLFGIQAVELRSRHNGKSCRREYGDLSLRTARLASVTRQLLDATPSEGVLSKCTKRPLHDLVDCIATDLSRSDSAILGCIGPRQLIS